MSALVQLQRHVTRLRGCDDCPKMIRPVVTGNPVLSPVMLIGQAPGVREGPAGKPFAWTAGKTMFGWFAQLGLSEDEFRQRVYMAAVCRCFPGKADRRRRRPRPRRRRDRALQPPPRRRGAHPPAAAGHPGRQARDRAARPRRGQARRDRRHRAAREDRRRRGRHDRAAAPVGRVDVAPHRARQDPARRARSRGSPRTRRGGRSLPPAPAPRGNPGSLAVAVSKASASDHLRRARRLPHPAGRPRRAPPATSARSASTSRRCSARAAPTRSSSAPAPAPTAATGAYVFARWGTPRRIINAHVDTVPANAGWSRDPWTPHVDDGRLYGLGSADTKGAIAATLVALDAARRHAIAACCSPATRRPAAASCTRSSPRRTRARSSEVIVCEPTARAAGIAHRGVLGQTRDARAAPAATRRRPITCPKPIATLARLAVALDDAGLRRLGDGPPGMTGHVPQHRRARTAASRST